jgi:nucleoside-diphosphate-sugar epimerase
MKIFISGATGFIGSELVKELLKHEHCIHALYRDDRKIIMKDKNLRYFKGEITDSVSIEKAMQGCSVVFHLAAYAKVWAKDSQVFYKINTEGTKNILASAYKLNVKRVIITSTAGVIGYSDITITDENHQPENEYFTDYEKSKHLAEIEIEKFSRKGLETVTLLPSRLYGPGLLSESNAVTLLIKKYIESKWHFLPGNGNKSGNYVFIRDVIKGHINAMNKNVTGERFILGGTNISYKSFFDTIGKVNGEKQWMIPVPVFVIILASAFMWLLAVTLNIKPSLTPGWARKYLHNWNLSSKKAIEKLDYTITPLEKGLKETIDWLNSAKKTE